MISATVAGHVGNEPELRTAGERNTPVLNFSVASSSAKRDGETTWVRVSLFGDRANTLAPMIHKGDRIAVSGRAELRKWEKNGKSGVDLELNASDVHLIEKKDESRAEQSTQRQAAPTASSAPAKRRF